MKRRGYQSPLHSSVTSRGGFLILAALAGAIALGTYLVAGHLLAKDARGAPRPAALGNAPTEAHATPAHVAAGADAAPTAGQFAVLLTSLSNLYGSQHHKTARFAGADCVPGTTPGHYMCSYVIVRPGQANECHLIQAEWTPNAASTFKVTLSGRVPKCGSLREALASVR